MRGSVLATLPLGVYQQYISPLGWIDGQTTEYRWPGCRMSTPSMAPPFHANPSGTL